MGDISGIDRSHFLSATKNMDGKTHMFFFEARGSNAEERLGTCTLFFSGEMERNEILLLPLFRYLTYLVFYCSAEYMG